MTIQYKFSENVIVNDIMDYVNKTYESHYAQTKNYQATEIIIDQGHGTGFCMGNILKYAQRYGKKEGRNKDDLLKVIHYAIIQLSQDHYESLDEPELKSVTSEKYGGEINLETNKFKSVILDDLLKK
jgi:hypothetical protein|tara:strand:- start:742 stop:1122 length:381 start_codon:yes stop_codon:yes gene_type:complete